MGGGGGTCRVGGGDGGFWAEPCVEYHVVGRAIGGEVGGVEGGIDDVGETHVVAQGRKLCEEGVLCEVDGVMMVMWVVGRWI